jgi:hypothetical protein
MSDECYSAPFEVDSEDGSVSRIVYVDGRLFQEARIWLAWFVDSEAAKALANNRGFPARNR